MYGLYGCRLDSDSDLAKYTTRSLGNVEQIDRGLAGRWISEQNLFRSYSGSPGRPCFWLTRIAAIGWKRFCRIYLGS